MKSKPSDSILTRLQQTANPRRSDLLGDVPYYLAYAILHRHTFDTVESFVAFCGIPDHLRSWLPSEVDRIIYSDELVRRLEPAKADPPTRSETPCRGSSPKPDTPCDA